MNLDSDNYCFVCGKENPAGLKLDFEIDRESGTIKTEFTPSKIYQGYKNIIHGGIISAVLDEAMVKLAFGLGMNAVTASIDTKFRKPLFAGERMIVSAKLNNRDKRVIKASARALKVDGTVIADAQALLVRME